MTNLKSRAASQAPEGLFCTRGCTQRQRNGWSAFTLLEVIAVVALLAILASLLTPALIQSMDQASKVRDASELRTIADAFQSAIRRQGKIPAPVDMPAFIAVEMGVASSQVLTNSRSVQRLFLTDPLLALGASGLPYDQTLDGITNTLPRSNLRVLILSSVGSALPAANQIDFNTAWATPDSITPADWTSWPGQGSDLTIQRLDLTSLFHRLILNPGGSSLASFWIESGGAGPLPTPAQKIRDSWYLDKTVLSLYTSTSPQSLQLKAVISEDVSYFYDPTTLSWTGSLK